MGFCGVSSFLPRVSSGSKRSMLLLWGEEGAGGGGVASGAFHQCDRYEQVFKIDEKWFGALVCNKSISYSMANQVVERL